MQPVRRRPRRSTVPDRSRKRTARSRALQASTFRRTSRAGIRAFTSAAATSDQVAYEFDGIPTTRQSDLATIGTLTSLGNQEVQVYTGGTPATSNSSGLAGYINQVIKTGTFPGYATADLGIGAPAFYHQATVESRRRDARPAFLLLRRTFGDAIKPIVTAISSAASASRSISIRSTSPRITTSTISSTGRAARRPTTG